MSLQASSAPALFLLLLFSFSLPSFSSLSSSSPLRHQFRYLCLLLSSPLLLIPSHISDSLSFFPYKHPRFARSCCVIPFTLSLTLHLQQTRLHQRFKRRVNTSRVNLIGRPNYWLFLLLRLNLAAYTRSMHVSSSLLTTFHCFPLSPPPFLSRSLFISTP